jgi:triosephosphate isomerase
MALKEALYVMLCVGETEEEKNSNQTFSVIQKQIETALNGTSSPSFIRIAYEPVWAIGTGRTPSPEQVQDVHAFIRDILSVVFTKEDAKKIPILYGGSVKSDNAALFLSQSDVNGALVGGASLEIDSFLSLIKIASLC